jgi:hypothetical protein
MSYLDFLIQDCLREYANDYTPSAIDVSSAQSTQSDIFIDVPILPEQRLFDMQPMLVSPAPSDIAMPFSFKPAQPDIISPVSPAEATLEAPKSRLKCSQCSNSYLGSRQLKRHMKKHSTPNKYNCTIVGCEYTTYRIDGMRSHIKTHERRILKEHKAPCLLTSLRILKEEQDQKI